ncbi:UNVERIFIED_CONTAM: hypothetical protein FKN15_055980 [Acipenser sinensis]
MVYREDFFIRHSIIVQSVMLRAWIVHSHNYNHSTGYRDGYQQAVNKTYSILKSLPPYQRPFKKHNKSLQWGAKLMWRLTENRINQCPHETDAVEMLSFPHACTGERYGVVKTFYSFNNSDFEKTRIQQVGDPRFTLSMWMYFLNSCKHASCVIVHHISPNNTYGTPLVLLTETGDITIQARCVSGQDSAFRAHVKLSMRRWHRLDLSVDRTMKLSQTIVTWEPVSNKAGTGTPSISTSITGLSPTSISLDVPNSTFPTVWTTTVGHSSLKADLGDGHSLDSDAQHTQLVYTGDKSVSPKHQNGPSAISHDKAVLFCHPVKKKQGLDPNSQLWMEQKTLARMLFWGQNGVSKNVTAAAKWYARSALEMEDPQAMYDLAIILFKGQGVKKNKTFALQLMKKAAEKGSVQALNGLGWYYHTFKADLVTATKYFEKAAQNESSAAFFNLGIFYLNGLYPGKSGQNQTAAFELFLKAAVDGHFDAVIECSQFYATGQLSTVSRDPEMAAKMAKEISEQNGNLGYVVKMALDAYMERSWNEAFLHYLVAAEAGMEVAQSNIAYMCEEWPQYLFMYRINNSVSLTAYLKMGDYFYYGLKNRSRNIKLSIAMYANAASADDSQAFFNLASLVEEGHRIPKRILKHLQIDRAVWSDNLTVALKLYER